MRGSVSALVCITALAVRAATVEIPEAPFPMPAIAVPEFAARRIRGERLDGPLPWQEDGPRLQHLHAVLRAMGRGALVLAVAYFVMVWIGKSERREVVRTHIVETAKRIYGAPEFFYYALADGIQKLFTRFGKWSAKLDLKNVLLKPSP